MLKEWVRLVRYIEEEILIFFYVWGIVGFSKEVVLFLRMLRDLFF